MKEAAAGAEGVYADAVRHLFGLGDDAGQARKPRRGSRSPRRSSSRRRSATRAPDVAIVPITTAGDRDRSKPFGEIGARDVFVKEIEEALARRPDRRGRPLRQGHDLDGHGRPRGRRVPAAGGPPGTRSAARPASGRACASAPPRFAAGPSCSRSSRASRSSRCAGTSTRVCASGERGLDAIVLAAPARAARPRRRDRASLRRRSCSRAGQGAVGLQVRAGEEELVDSWTTRRRGGASRPSGSAWRGSAAAASLRSPLTTTAPG